MPSRPGSALLVSLLAVVAAPGVAGAQSSTPVPFPVVNGTVRALLVDGRTAYVGGHFRSLGNPTGPLAWLDPGSGKVRRGFPSIAGHASDEAYQDWPGVLAVEPDGAGGQYVAGHFSRVAGVRRSAVVHLRRDGSVDRRFQADVQGRVHSLALARGRLWIGGAFQRAAGGERDSLAVVDARTGALTPVAQGHGGGQIEAIEHAGSRVYVGGINHGLVAFDAASGELLQWSPGPIGWARDIAVRGDKVYVVTGSVVELAAADGRVLRYFATDGGEALAMAIAGDTLVVGGYQHTDTHRGLFAFDLRTGERLPKFADVVADVTALAVHRGTVYATRVWRAGGQDRGGLVAFSLATGKVRWEVQEDAYVADLRIDRGRLVAAGLMRTVGSVRRENLAAIDIPTGRVKRFNPKISGVTYNIYFTPYVSALAKRGRELYVGGSYGYVGGKAHPDLAAVDVRTGRLRNTVPPAGGIVYALARAGSKLYAGGDFLSLGDVQRTNLGAVDLRSRRVTSWAPEARSEVYALATGAGRLYAGGDFEMVGDRTDARGLVAFDLRSGQLIPGFEGPIGGIVTALAADRGRGVWVGGSLGGFSEPGERGLAHLDAAGRALGGVPVVDGAVQALALRGRSVFIGGTFDRVGSRPRGGLAALRGGAVTRFDPGPTGRWPMALAALPGGGLLAAGDFNATEQRTTSGLARFPGR